MRKTKSKPWDEAHVRLYFAEMESEAFKALSPETVCIVLEMRKEYHGRPDNRFSLPYSEIDKRRPMHVDKISRAVIEAEAFGWIDCPVRGGLYRQANVYALSGRWKEISKDPELLAQAKRKVKDWEDDRLRKRRKLRGNPPWLK